jgi:adenine-specific DNA-methyltransferase
LREDGVIFISIDDNEVDNLKKICNEVFGEENFIEQIVWKRRANTPNDRFIGKIHEYIVVYAKSIKETKLYLQPRSKEIDEKYKNPNNDPRGPWFADNLSANGKGGRLAQSCVFPIRNLSDGKDYYPPQNKCWLYNKEKIDEFIIDGRIGFRENSGAPYLKRFLSEVRQGSTLPTIITDAGVSVDSAKEIRELFKTDVFEFPKPTALIKKFLKCGSNSEDIVLDFFSGSATTADAVMQLNAEDGGKRKFIIVQLPEVCGEDSEAYKAGYKTICEIGKERIRLAGDKINKAIIKDNEQLKNKEEAKPLVDIGFRVLKVDSTNMKEVYYAANEYSQLMLSGLESNIKDDRTDLDLLYGILLDWGLQLSLSHRIEEIHGVTIHTVDENSLIACFAEKVCESVVRDIAKRQPLRVVFRDSSFENSPDKINVEEIFKLLAPNTTVKVI